MSNSHWPPESSWSRPKRIQTTATASVTTQVIKNAPSPQNTWPVSVITFYAIGGFIMSSTAFR